MSDPAPQALVVRVRFVEGRYHGVPEWPPAPARLFQALVAAAAAPEVSATDDAALRWLETLPPPIVAMPRVTIGHTRKVFVPNNDLDAKGGDPAAVASIRSAKLIRPRIFDPVVPLLYAWPIDDPQAEALAVTVCELARRIYQLGRGIDAAHASASMISGDELRQALAEHVGEVLRPGKGAPGRASCVLSCPCSGSLARLHERHRASLSRFGAELHAGKRVPTFRQPPKPFFVEVTYQSPPIRALFEMRPSDDMSRFAVIPASRVVSLIERVRDAAADRLRDALPKRAVDIERALVGRLVEGAPRLPGGARVRLIPLPSIGSDHADRGVRRILVEVPSAGPLRADDVFWALSNLVFAGGLGVEVRLTRAAPLDGMALRYGVGGDQGHVRWRTVTAAALPLQIGGATSGTQRLVHEQQVQNAVRDALRHAEIETPVEAIRVQHEPFSAKGSPSRAFAPDTRFDRARIWHVELTFGRAILGPIVVGDGRFLGLGVFAPVSTAPRSRQVLAFAVTSGLVEGHPEAIAGALRRAVMARFQSAVGRTPLPAWVSGHEPDGARTTDPHLSFVFDPDAARLLIVAPPWSRSDDLRTLRQALDGFTELRAGAAGLLSLRGVALDDSTDLMLRPHHTWVSSTPYVVDRHRKARSAADALRADLRAACRDRGLPPPRVEVLETRGVAGVGLTGRAELHFEVAVPGPILLGRTCHRGGGLFRPLATP